MMEAETIRAVEFVGALNQIADLTAEGRRIEPFGGYSPDSDDGDEDPGLFREEDSELVCDTVDDAGTLDIMCTWSDVFPGAHFKVMEDDDGGQYVDVAIDGSTASFVCEGGRWYVSSYD